MAITEGAVIAVSGADASAGTLNLTAANTVGGGGALLFVVHEGAPTTYTWTSQSGGSGGTFNALATVNSTGGASSGDLSINAVFVYGYSGNASHVFRVTLGASRPFRYGGGVILNGTFGATYLAATTQTAQDPSLTTTVDAGSLVTDAAAYLIQFGGNYNGVAASAAGGSWALKSNATAGRHFQARNEAASGTFDPVYTLAGTADWLTIAAAIKETAGGGGGLRRRGSLGLLGVGR